MNIQLKPVEKKEAKTAEQAKLDVDLKVTELRDHFDVGLRPRCLPLSLLLV